MDDVAAARSEPRPRRTPGPLRLGGREFPPERALVMAIVNRTPDSFYRPGVTWDEDAALERVHAIVAEGADLLDVGGVPAKPGPEVTVAEEIRRVVPFIERVRAAYPDLVISVDTWRHEPARAACEAGADLLNDTWSAWDPKVADVAAEFGVGLVCSHVGVALPRTRPHRAAFADVAADVLDRVLLLAGRALAAGVEADRIVIDPAHDFGKNTWHSLEVTRRLGELTATGWPVLMSASRKDFVGETLGVGVDDRLAGTLAATAVGAWLGARIFRAHDVLQPARPWTWSPRSRATARRPAPPGASHDRRRVIVRAALCPSPPLLASGVTGQTDVLPELREACEAAVGWLLAAAPDAVTVIGPAATTATWPPDSVPDLSMHAPALSRLARLAAARPARIPPAPCACPLPLSLAIGAQLLDAAGYAGPRVLQSVAESASPDACRDLGRDLAADAPLTALLVMGDGSARRSAAAPGYLDERAEPFDTVVEQAAPRRRPARPRRPRPGPRPRPAGRRPPRLAGTSRRPRPRHHQARHPRSARAPGSSTPTRPSASPTWSPPSTPPHDHEDSCLHEGKSSYRGCF